MTRRRERNARAAWPVGAAAGKWLAVTLGTVQ